MACTAEVTCTSEGAKGDQPVLWRTATDKDGTIGLKNHGILFT